MGVKSSQLIKSCGTRTDPAAKTKSIGLHRLPSAAIGLPTAKHVAAAEQGRPTCLPEGRRTTGVVFAKPSGQLHRDTTTRDCNLTTILYL